MASENLNVGTAANANDGDTLRAAFIKVKKMFADIYGQTYSEQGDLSGTDYKVKASQVKTTNSAGSGVDGYVLTYDHSSGGFTFEQKFDGDITSIVAGNGLTGSSLDTDDATLNVIGGDGITVNADEVEATVDGVTIELSASDGTGALRVKDDGITPAKINILDDSLAATDGHIMVADGTDFSNVAVSGDATLSNTGALTIGNDKITEAKLGAEFTTTSAISASAVDFSSAAVFTKTLSANTTLTFSNVTTGAVKTLVISGDYTLTLPSGVKTLNGTYSGTADSNVIQIISTNGSTEMFATISNYSAS